MLHQNNNNKVLVKSEVTLSGGVRLATWQRDEVCKKTRKITPDHISEKIYDLMMV